MNFWEGVKHPWQLIRPYVTPVRVAAVLGPLLSPLAAAAIAWLALQLAKVGVELNTTEALAVYAVVFTGVITAAVTAIRRFIDNRTQFETALIGKGYADLIQGKALSAIYPVDVDPKAADPDPVGWEPPDEDVHISDINPEIDDQPDELDPEEDEDPDVLPDRPERV